MTRHPSGLLRIAPEVETALVHSQAVVALESSLVAHGLPPDIGPDVGRAAEARVREHGAVPATIAVIDGTVRVGVEDEVLARLAVEPDVRKVGPRDLATCAVSGAWGATTVAGTLAVCAVAGIHFMATGGIGGVHRGWAETRDVSADLDEIARTSVCVVCSGAKSLLDVPATLETLEIARRAADRVSNRLFPLFYVRESSHPVPDRADDADAIAAAAAAHWGFARSTGVIVAQPVAEDVALDASDLERTIEGAVAGAAASGVRGPAVTPHVLAAVHAATGGRSLEANRRLVVDNAGLAAEIAAAYYS